MIQPRLTQHLMLLLALFPALAAAQGTPQDLSGDPRVAWLRENVLPIRSIDPHDEDFSEDRLEQAFAFDRHFRTAGFDMLA